LLREWWNGLRARLLLAALLCIVGIVIYWTPIKIEMGNENIILGGYPKIAEEKGTDPSMWLMLGYVLTALLGILCAFSIFLAIKIGEVEEVVEEYGEYGVYEEEYGEEETITYEEEFYEF